MSSTATRLARMFDAGSGHMFSLGIDHGLDMGYIDGLRDPVGLVDAMRTQPVDGFIMSLGLFRQTQPFFADRSAPSRIMTMDTHYDDGNASSGMRCATVEDAVREGADGVKVLMPWYEASSHKRYVTSMVSDVIHEAMRWEMPVMVEPLILDPAWDADARTREEANACRIAVELGADLLKIENPRDNDVLREWVGNFRVPIVVLGGGLDGSGTELVSMVAEIMTTGIRGIVFGRNIFQRSESEAMHLVTSLAEILHRPCRVQ